MDGVLGGDLKHLPIDLVKFRRVITGVGAFGFTDGQDAFHGDDQIAEIPVLAHQIDPGSLNDVDDKTGLNRPLKFTAGGRAVDDRKLFFGKRVLLEVTEDL